MSDALLKIAKLEKINGKLRSRLYTIETDHAQVSREFERAQLKLEFSEARIKKLEENCNADDAPSMDR